MRIILTILFLWVLSANATNYYVASAGSNSNNGTSTGTPFQTIAKVISVVAKHDSVFLNRGDSWNEKITIPFDSLYFGAYGSGNKPIITGFQTIPNSAWTDSANIWSATISSSVAYLNTVTINDTIRAKGRYPNHSYLNYSAIDQFTIKSTNGLTVDSLTGVPDYTGAEVAIRSANYVLDVVRIASQSTSTLHFVEPTTYVPAGTGFFLQNSKKVCDSMNEWGFDSTNKIIYIYSIDTPRNVKYSTIDTSIYMFKRNAVTFDNLNVQGSNSIGIDADSSNHITVQNCTIKNIGGYNSKGFTTKGGQGGAAIRGENSVRLIVINDSIINSLNNGVFAIHSSDSMNISQTYIKSSGALAGMGCSGNGAYIGIFTQGINDTVITNKVITNGYNGIQFYYNAYVKNNLVDTYCFNKDDGGGIYAPSTDNTGSIVRGNIILNGLGAPQNPYLAHPAIGVYMDNGVIGVLVDSNFISNCLDGILTNQATKINIYDNTVCVNNTNPNLILGVGGADSINVKRNIFYSSYGATNTSIYSLGAQFSSITSDSNYLLRPNYDSLYKFQLGSNYYSLSGWQRVTPYDVHSKQTPSGITSLTPSIYYNTNSTDSTINFSGRKVSAKGDLYLNTVTIKPFGSIILFDIPSNYKKKIGAFLFN